MADVDSIPNLGHLQKIFFALHIGAGHIGLPILIITFFLDREAPRHPTLINFCFSWVLYSISYCLTLYTGEKLDASQTPSRTCRAQAVLVHGTPTMSAAAGLMVVIQLWSTLRHPSQASQRSGSRLLSIKPALALAYPYVVFFAFILVSIIIVEQNPNSVSGANGLYCTIFQDPFRQYGVPSFSAATLLFIICFEVSMAIRCFRLRSEINRVFPLANRSRPPLSMICRVTIFNVYSVITLSATMFFLSNNLSPWPYMVQAALPLAALIVFGTQRDLFSPWWRRARGRSSQTSATAELEIPHFEVVRVEGTALHREDTLSLVIRRDGAESTSTPTVVVEYSDTASGKEKPIDVELGGQRTAR